MYCANTVVFGVGELAVGVVCRERQRLISQELVKRLIKHFKHSFNILHFNEEINYDN